MYAEIEAREAAARLLEVDPSFTISGWIARGGQSNAKLLIEGLRKAALDEATGVRGGLLLGYGGDFFTVAVVRAADYVDKILRGAKPSEQRCPFHRRGAMPWISRTDIEAGLSALSASSTTASRISPFLVLAGLGGRHHGWSGFSDIRWSLLALTLDRLREPRRSRRLRGDTGHAHNAPNLRLTPQIVVDIAYGGNFYAIVEPQKNFRDLADHTAGELVAWSPRLRAAHRIFLAGIDDAHFFRVDNIGWGARSIEHLEACPHSGLPQLI